LIEISVWFTIQSTTHQFLTDGEMLTETCVYTIWPISTPSYCSNSYLCTF